MLYNHVVEIGAGDRYSSEGLAIARRGEATRMSLFEPNAILHADLLAVLPEYYHVNLYPWAIIGDTGWMTKGIVLYHFGYASFLCGAPSFLVTSTEPEGEQFWAPVGKRISAMRIGMVDDGSWDYLILTCNGCELEILQGLKSRPRIIQTKHYCHNARQWVETRLIWEWLEQHGYKGTVLDTNQHGTFFSIAWQRQGV